MSKSYLTLIAIGLAGKTVAAGEFVDLTEEQADTLLANGSVMAPPPADEKSRRQALIDLPDDVFDAHLAAEKLDGLKALAALLEIEVGDAKTKADFVALIKAAREAAK